MNGLGAVLKTPDVCKSGIGPGHQFLRHHIRHEGEIESTVLTGQGHAVHTGLSEHSLVLCSTGCVGNAAVLTDRTVVVHLLGIGGDGVGAYLAHDLHHLIV